MAKDIFHRFLKVWNYICVHRYGFHIPHMFILFKFDSYLKMFQTFTVNMQKSFERLARNVAAVSYSCPCRYDASSLQIKQLQFFYQIKNPCVSIDDLVALLRWHLAPSALDYGVVCLRGHITGVRYTCLNESSLIDGMWLTQFISDQLQPGMLSTGPRPVQTSGRVKVRS